MVCDGRDRKSKYTYIKFWLSKCVYEFFIPNVCFDQLFETKQILHAA